MPVLKVPNADMTPYDRLKMFVQSKGGPPAKETFTTGPGQSLDNRLREERGHIPRLPNVPYKGIGAGNKRQEASLWDDGLPQDPSFMEQAKQFLAAMVMDPSNVGMPGVGLTYRGPKGASRTSADVMMNPSRSGREMLPPERQLQPYLPYYGPSASAANSNIQSIGDILENYQQTTRKTLDWMRGDPAARKLGFVEGDPIPQNIRRVRNNAILRDDTRAMSVDDIVKDPNLFEDVARNNSLYAQHKAKKLRPTNFLNEREGPISPSPFSDVERRKEIMGRWDKKDTDLNYTFTELYNKLDPVHRSRIDEIVDSMPPSQEFLNETATYRSGDRAAQLYDFLSEHPANQMALDDPMVRDMLGIFDNPRPPVSTMLPRETQSVIPFVDQSARDALMDFYNKTQRYTPTTPLKRGQLPTPTPEGGNTAFRDFRESYMGPPDVEIPGVREPIQVRRYDVSAESPLPEFMLKQRAMGPQGEEFWKPFVVDLNKPQPTVDEILLELMNRSPLPPNVR